MTILRELDTSDRICMCTKVNVYTARGCIYMYSRCSLNWRLHVPQDVFQVNVLCFQCVCVCTYVQWYQCTVCQNGCHISLSSRPLIFNRNKQLKGHNDKGREMVIVVTYYPTRISCFERCIEVMLSLASSSTCTGSCVRDLRSHTRTDES